MPKDTLNNQLNANTQQKQVAQSSDNTIGKHKVDDKADQAAEKLDIQTKNQTETIPPQVDNQTKKLKTLDLRKSLLVKASVLGVIDLLAFFLLIYYIGQTSFVVSDIKDAMKDNVAVNENAVVGLKSQIAQNQTQLKMVDSFFHDEIGYVHFVKEIDGLRSAGLVSNFELRSKDYIRDKTKSLGLPFVAEFTGSSDILSEGVNRLQNLPFIVRPINVTIDRVDDTTFILTYGGFLYVDEILGQN